MATTLIVQDYILLIMNCKKYRPKAMVQKNTWLKQLPPNLIYYHVIGDPDLQTDFQFVDEERVLYVKTKDDYNSLPYKVINAYDAVNKTFQFKYIFKTDDDQTVTNIKFFNMVVGMLEKMDLKIHYAGNVVNVTQAYLSKYHTIHPELPKDLPILPIKYCNGRFYLLSKEAVLDLLTRKSAFYKEYLEDYAVGLHLNDSFKNNVLHIQTDQFFKDFIQ